MNRPALVNEIAKRELIYLRNQGWTEDQLQILVANSPNAKSLQKLGEHNSARKDFLADLRLAIAAARTLLKRIKKIRPTDDNGTPVDAEIEQSLLDQIKSWLGVIQIIEQEPALSRGVERTAPARRFSFLLNTRLAALRNIGAAGAPPRDLSQREIRALYLIANPGAAASSSDEAMEKSIRREQRSATRRKDT